MSAQAPGYLWPERPSPPGSLQAINERIHQTIEDALVDHLEALAALDLTAAAAAWQRLEVILAAHTDVEDATALARFTELGNFLPGGRPELFEAEHTNIHRLLVKLGDQMSEFQAGDPALRRTVVRAVLHRYHLFFHVLDHHTRREQNAMYPRLEAELDAAERTAIGRRLTETHEAALARARPA